MIATALLASVLVVAAAPPERTVRENAQDKIARETAQGQIRSAGERTPVAGATVFATARKGPKWTREAVTDDDGRFMLVGYRLPRRWSIAGRFRLVTGLPYTPYVGAVEFAPDVYTTAKVLPIVGGVNSARMPVFHQLDLRVDRTWILRRAIVSAYLDVQNVYNRQNAEGMLYTHDFTAARAVVGMPILPVLGVKLNY